MVLFNKLANNYETINDLYFSTYACTYTLK